MVAYEGAPDVWARPKGEVPPGTLTYEMCNEISSSKGEETKEWFEHCQTVEESAHN
jgi:hypothetical protein